jgi:hypothetical protein
MAIPKTRTPLAERISRTQIQQAFHLAGNMQTPGVSPEEGAPRRFDSAPEAAETQPRITLSSALPVTPPPQPAAPATLPPPVTAPAAAAPLPAMPAAKRIGRPPLKDDRTERLNAVVSESTRDRLRIALYGENVRTKGKIDQSLIIEPALPVADSKPSSSPFHVIGMTVEVGCRQVCL